MKQEEFVSKEAGNEWGGLQQILIGSELNVQFDHLNTSEESVIMVIKVYIASSSGSTSVRTSDAREHATNQTFDHSQKQQ